MSFEDDIDRLLARAETEAFAIYDASTSCHWCLERAEGMAKHTDSPEPIVDCCENCGRILGVGFRTYAELDADG